MRNTWEIERKTPCIFRTLISLLWIELFHWVEFLLFIFWFLWVCKVFTYLLNLCPDAILYRHLQQLARCFSVVAFQVFLNIAQLLLLLWVFELYKISLTQNSKIEMLYYSTGYFLHLLVHTFTFTITCKSLFLRFLQQRVSI